MQEGQGFVYRDPVCGKPCAVHGREDISNGYFRTDNEGFEGVNRGLRTKMFRGVHGKKWVLFGWFCASGFLFPFPASAHGVGAVGLDVGKKIYRLDCAVCHGPGGRGDGKGARRLNPPPPDFARPGFWNNKSDSYLFHIISNGIEDMPGWSDKLAPGQITDVLHYLRSLSAPTIRKRPVPAD